MRKIWIALLALIALTGCSIPDRTVIAPSGPAAVAVGPAVDDVMVKQKAEKEALNRLMSKISGSALSIKTINAKQPASLIRTGIESEASIIQSLAGDPDPQEQIDALARANSVLEAKVEVSEKAYSEANKASSEALKAYEGTTVALVGSNTALSKAATDAKVEASQSAQKFQAEIDRVKNENSAEKTKSRAKIDLMVNAILFGLGSIGIGVGIWMFVAAPKVPMFGPMSSAGIASAGAGLFSLGIVYNKVGNLIDDHPVGFLVSLGVVAAVAVASFSLIYSNHRHATES